MKNTLSIKVIGIKTLCGENFAMISNAATALERAIAQKISALTGSRATSPERADVAQRWAGAACPSELEMKFGSLETSQHRMAMAWRCPYQFRAFIPDPSKAMGPEKTANRDSAFEFSTQRGEGWLVTWKVETGPCFDQESPWSSVEGLSGEWTCRLGTCVAVDGAWDCETFSTDLAQRRILIASPRVGQAVVI